MYEEVSQVKLQYKSEGKMAKQWIELDASEVRQAWDQKKGIIISGLVFINPTEKQWEANDCQATTTVQVIKEGGDLVYYPKAPYENWHVEIPS